MDGEELSPGEAVVAIEAIRASSAIEAASRQASMFADKARRSLARLPAHSAFDSLAELVTYATERNR